MKKILTVFGTRPEAIKMAPVVKAVADHPQLQGVVCVTAQHRSLLDQVLDLFAIHPDHDLDLMTPDQDLPSLTARILTALTQVLQQEQPDVVLVHGDTTTAFSTALAAFYAGIPVGHVEAGLRTHDLQYPFPEEANRQLVGRLARFHFAPTEAAVKNLLAEGIPRERIHQTGNTVIDALLMVRARLNGNHLTEHPLQGISGERAHAKIQAHLAGTGEVLLITGHRRENFGQGFQEICQALKEIASRRPELLLIYPVHLNPNVLAPVRSMLGNTPNILLTPPLDYLSFVALLDRSTLILTDSGGIQEEAPSFGKPVLVMRDTTERPEAIVAGTSRLVGADRERIVSGVLELLENPASYQQMSQAHNPFGDGEAANRIAEILALSPSA
ncbi:MAG: UDP-N-acetylglucosamine 2-epimerase (non-hydrolyzing) [Magnetococcales bacterium]|nr:UDP-N-acetylglucosamine 2-epimerase (non-hydrolyzing) [Magnetococcales bacterium]